MPAGPPASGEAQQTLEAAGRIKAQLHGPRGDLNGVLLEDGTIVRLPPPEGNEACRTADGRGIDHGPWSRHRRSPWPRHRRAFPRPRCRTSEPGCPSAASRPPGPRPPGLDAPARRRRAPPRRLCKRRRGEYHMENGVLTWLHIGDLHLTGDTEQNYQDLKRIAGLVGGFAGRGRRFCRAARATMPMTGHPNSFVSCVAPSRPCPCPCTSCRAITTSSQARSMLFTRCSAPTGLPKSVIVPAHRCLFLDVVSAGSGGPRFPAGQRTTRLDRTGAG